MTGKTLPQVRKARLPYIDRSREMAWIAAHQEEYAGQWVVLFGDQLIGHGDDPVPILEKARQEGIDRPLVVHLRKETGPFTGGWL
jgi:Family of unknown function (DUF5678)